MNARHDLTDLGAPQWVRVQGRVSIPPGWQGAVARHLSTVVEHRIPHHGCERATVFIRVCDDRLRLYWSSTQFDDALGARIDAEANKLSAYLRRRCARCGQRLRRDAPAPEAGFFPSCERHPALPITDFLLDRAQKSSDLAGARSVDAEAGRAAELTTIATEASTPGRPLHRLYDTAVVKTVGGELERQATDDQRRRIRDDIARMLLIGGERPWGTPTVSIDAVIAKLATGFPNFEEVIEDCVRPALQLGQLTARPSLAPMLLAGPPSAGKTYFANAVAEELGTPCLRIDMATAQCNAMLAGSALFWGNSRPGLLWSLLIHGPGSGPVGATANPVVILDEVDKVNARGYDPLAPLYALLERDSARRFEDVGMPGIPLDASQVIWVLTCNDTSGLPEPILSRVRTFHIREHTWAERRAIAARLVASVTREWGLANEVAAEPEVLDRLADLSPRAMRPVIDAALGQSAARGCDRLISDDLPPPRPQADRHPLGFVHDARG